MKKLKKIKAYITYAKYNPNMDGYSCVLVFENGCAPFSHFCSSEHFMQGDLWNHRANRKQALENMGYEVELTEPIRDIDVPEELIKKNKDKKSYQDFQKQLDEELATIKGT